MTKLRALLLMSWTLSYGLVATMLYGLVMMGDCAPAPYRKACEADKAATGWWMAVGALLGYLLLTWIMFNRRSAGSK